MTVWVFEDNLMWSVRLVRALRALGHEAEAVPRVPDQGKTADVAIVNLGSAALPGAEIGPILAAQGVYVIAHAGHKEKPLLSEGARAGCHRVATNSETTHKLGALMEEASTWISAHRAGTRTDAPA
ncbi:MAG: hypothetical protein KIS66_15455 [Fimbriimonadaceae bacterium]|nr:hypothetical protein [Fimbriimonadaceae bacterium]